MYAARKEREAQQALKAQLSTQMKAKKHDHVVSSKDEPPAAKKAKMSKRLENCPGVKKVSLDDDFLVEEGVIISIRRHLLRGR